ncbi:MAG: hypothetical protein KC439_09350 [Yoonia sp.]|nr:hypothetical protein [Yoonia sp.]
MTNGTNSHNVSYPQIMFLTGLLNSHTNTASVMRSNDIQFDIQRNHGDDIRLICLNEYTCGLAKIYEVLDEFPGTNLFYVGGNWNSYTLEAKEYCLQSQFGLYNSAEINGGLHRNDFWAYHQRDRKGDPLYQTKGS